MEVDWVGDTLKVYDAASSSDISAYIFVAVLPCSLYGYAEAFPDMKSNHWIDSGCKQETVEKVRAYLEELGVFDEILETRAGGVISSHCGPGTLGVLYIAKS